MKNNQYPINVTDDIDIINNHCHDNYRSQLSNSQNNRNEIQNTQQKSTEKIDQKNYGSLTTELSSQYL